MSYSFLIIFEQLGEMGGHPQTNAHIQNRSPDKAHALTICPIYKTHPRFTCDTICSM